MSDWISRGRAKAAAQDEALRRKWQGLVSQSTSSVQIQTPKISPAKPVGEGMAVTKQSEVKNPIAMLPRSRYFGLSDEMKAVAEDSIAKAAAQKELSYINSREYAHKQDVESQRITRLEDELKQKQNQAVGYARAGMVQQSKQAREEVQSLKKEIGKMTHVSALQEGEEFNKRQHYEIIATGGNALMKQLEEISQLKKDAELAYHLKANDEKQKRQAYKDALGQVKGQYGDQVDAWLEYIGRENNRKMIANARTEAVAFGKEHPVASSVASVGTNMLGGLGYMDVLGQKVENLLTGKDYPIDYNSSGQLPSVFTGGVRAGVSERIENSRGGKTGSFLYNTGMSMLDSATILATGNAGAVMLGGAAATNAMNEAIQRGASDDQALTIGFMAGITEKAMEKLSIDRLFKLKDPDTAADFVLNILKQSGTEGSEELLTNLANTVADVIIMGDKSDLYMAKQRYEEMDFEPEEATRLALRDFGREALTDAIGGFISGGTMALGKMGATATNQLINNLDDWGGWGGLNGMQWQFPDNQFRPAFAGGWGDLPPENRQFVPERNWQTPDGADFYIGRTAQNEPFVGVDTDILAGVPEKDWTKTVKENLKKKFPNGIVIGNNEIQIDRQSRGEMTYSEYMKRLHNKNAAIHRDKLQATNHADEILQATTNWINEDLNHSRKDNIVEFARGKVLLEIGGRDYSAEVVVGKRDNGVLLLYDILRLKPTKITKKR